MPERHDLDDLRRELDLWGEASRTAPLWLRDDDAVEPTPALEQLIARLRAHGAPCLLAVIPLGVGPALAERVAGEPLLRVAMHGIRHANHAPIGSKSAETPDERDPTLIRAELTEARGRLMGLFGAAAGDWYVPPWNRTGRAAAALLPELGFRALSTFGAQSFGLAPVLRELNAHVDLMDWRGGRVGRPLGPVAADLGRAFSLARKEDWRPVGLLAHHLVHDAAAWASLDALLALADGHPVLRWRTADDLVA